MQKLTPVVKTLKVIKNSSSLEESNNLERIIDQRKIEIENYEKIIKTQKDQLMKCENNLKDINEKMLSQKGLRSGSVLTTNTNGVVMSTKNLKIERELAQEKKTNLERVGNHLLIMVYKI